MRKYLVGLIVAIVAAASVATLGGPVHGSPAAANATPVTDDPDPDVYGPCDPNAPMSDENSCDDADTLPDIEGILNQLAPGINDTRLAGTWIDRSVTPSVQRIGLTGYTSADQATLDAITNNDPRVRFVASLFPLTQLTDLVDSVYNTLKISISTKLFAISVDIPQNRVEIEVTNATLANTVNGLLNTLLNTLDLPGLIVHVSTGYETPEAGVVTVNTIPPHVGGLAYRADEINGTTSRYCTVGYTIQSNGGTMMGLTAGHCAHGLLDDNVFVGTHYMSRSGMNSFRASNPSDSDGMRYTVPSSYLGSNQNYARIFVGGTTAPYYRLVTSPRYTTSSTSLQIGTRLCFFGVTSGAVRCGSVDKLNTKVTDTDGHTDRHLWHFTGRCQHGDSGGPVYHTRTNGTAKPAGVVSLLNSTGCWLSHLSYVLPDVDAQMVYWVTP